jgi:hypothetical protein
MRVLEFVHVPVFEIPILPFTQATGQVTAKPEVGLFGVKLTYNAHLVLLKNSARSRRQGRNADYSYRAQVEMGTAGKASAAMAYLVRSRAL